MLEIALRHRFSGFTLDTQFSVPPGVTALFGHSGSGKTTVVNAVAGLLRPEFGHIKLEGSVLLDTERGIALAPHLRRIGYVFQDARLFPHMSVAKNLVYGQRFARNPAPDGVTLERIVQILGLEALMDRKPGTLSGGEKQRVAIGRAMLSHPRLLLMDEPLAALDERRKGEILTYLERLQNEISLPILYVSHSVAEVARLATSLVVLDAGQVRVAGPLEKVMADPATGTAFGLREAGAVLSARLVGHDADGLSRLETRAGPLWLPQLAAPVGASLKLRILAHDVMIATQRPSGVSALNILPARVAHLREGEGPGALVQLALGAGEGESTAPDAPLLLARVTRRSVTALGLLPGKQVYAVLKAVSVARESVGAQNQVLHGAKTS